MKQQKQNTKTPADNGRFGASGAVPRPKVCANLEVYRPSERQWKPRLSPSRWDVSCNRTTHSRKESTI